MATKKYIEIGEMSDADLKAELVQIHGQYQKLRFDHTIKGLAVFFLKKNVMFG